MSSAPWSTGAEPLPSRRRAAVISVNDVGDSGMAAVSSPVAGGDVCGNGAICERFRRSPQALVPLLAPFLLAEGLHVRQAGGIANDDTRPPDEAGELVTRLGRNDQHLPTT